MIHLFVCGYRVESFSATARNAPLQLLPFALMMLLLVLVLKGPIDQGAASLIHVPIVIYKSTREFTTLSMRRQYYQVNNPSHYPSRSLKKKRFLRAPAWCEGTS